MTFPPLDVVTISRDLDLQAIGSSQGSRNEPDSQIDSLDGTEQKIISFINQTKATATQILHDNIEAYERRVAALSLDTTSNDIHNAAVNVLSEFRTQLSTGADRVYLARKRVVAIENELAAFRRLNCLDRIAHYPDTKIFLVGLLAVIFLIEAGLNGIFLGETHSFGILGGITEAIGIALVNIALGFVTGHLALPQLHHRKTSRKLLGTILLILYLPALVGFNLAVGHYRDALAGGFWDEATTIAIDTFRGSPLSINDIKSWLLFVLGIFFSSVALFDGYRWDDPYPGYGKLDRRMREILEEYANIKIECLDELEETKNQSIDLMREIKDDLLKQKGEYATIVASQQRLAGAYEGHLRNLELVGNELLTIYREANTIARSTPKPSHFSSHWSLEFEPAQKPSGIDQEKMIKAVNRAGSTLDRRILKVTEAYDKAVEAYRRIEQLTEEELFRGSAQTIVENVT